MLLNKEIFMWLGEDFNNMIVLAILIAMLIGAAFISIAVGILALIAHFIYKFAKPKRHD
jgi:hypothetical protein